LTACEVIRLDVCYTYTQTSVTFFISEEVTVYTAPQSSENEWDFIYA